MIIFFIFFFLSTLTKKNNIILNVDLELITHCTVKKKIDHNNTGKT